MVPPHRNHRPGVLSAGRHSENDHRRRLNDNSPGIPLERGDQGYVTLTPKSEKGKVNETVDYYRVFVNS